MKLRFTYSCEAMIAAKNQNSKITGDESQESRSSNATNEIHCNPGESCDWVGQSVMGW